MFHLLDLYFQEINSSNKLPDNFAKRWIFKYFDSKLFPRFISHPLLLKQTKKCPGRSWTWRYKLSINFVLPLLCFALLWKHLIMNHIRKTEAKNNWKESISLQGDIPPSMFLHRSEHTKATWSGAAFHCTLWNLCKISGGIPPPTCLTGHLKLHTGLGS